MSLLLLYLLLAIGVSFLCSILESVLMSTPLSYITMREEEGYRPAVRFKRYKQDIDTSIAAILALNTIANTFGAAGVGRQAQLLFGSTWFGVISAITTLLILVFAEIIPKSIGTGYYRRLMGFTVWMLSVLQVLMWPFVQLIRLVTRLLPEGEDPDSFSKTHTLEQVLAYMEAHEQDFISFKTDQLLSDAAGDPLRKANLINDIADTIAEIPDAVKRSVYVEKR